MNDKELDRLVKLKEKADLVEHKAKIKAAENYQLERIRKAREELNKDSFFNKLGKLFSSKNNKNSVSVGSGFDADKVLDSFLGNNNSKPVVRPPSKPAKSTKKAKKVRLASEAFKEEHNDEDGNDFAMPMDLADADKEISKNMRGLI